MNGSVRTRLALALVIGLTITTAATAQTTSIAVVPNNFDGTMSMIDTSTGQVVLAPTVGGAPESAVVSPDGRFAYVANDAGIVKVDIATGTILGTIAAGGAAVAVAVMPDGRKGYYADLNLNQVVPLDLTTFTAGTPINGVGSSPQAIVVAPDGKHAYVSATVSGEVAVIDTATDTVVTLIAVPVDPRGIAISADNATAYVASQGFTFSIYVLDLTTNTTKPSIPTGAISLSVVLSRDGKTLYAGGNNSVKVIDLTNTANVSTITLPNSPSTPSLRGVALTPDGATLFAIDWFNNLLWQIDVATQTVQPSPLVVGNAPESWTNFMSPLYVIAGGPLGITDDNGLTTEGFGPDFLDFNGGAALLSAPWTTTRTVSLLAAGGTLVTNGFDATLTKGIVGDGTLTKAGAGRLTIAGGTASHTGGTRINDGVLEVDGTHLGPVMLNGGTLSGTGTVGAITNPGGGTISPGGATTPGTLTADSLALSSGTGVTVRLASPSIYDSLHGTGTLNLSSAILTLTTLNGYKPGPGDAFTIATNTTGQFVGYAEGTTTYLQAADTYLHITYTGGAGGHDAVLAVDRPPTISAFAPLEVDSDTIIPPIPFTIGDDFTDPSNLAITVDSPSTQLISSATVTGTGATRMLHITLVPQAVGQAVVTVLVRDQSQQLSSKAQAVTVRPAPRRYYLAEGATGPFFSTDILIGNPNTVITPATITFYKADGTTQELTYQLSPTSRLTLPVASVPGMEATAFSTTVVSTTGQPLVVERTMWWDRNGYGSHGEKASAGPATTWYFAEGSQGYFHTYYLLFNPNPAANVAHVTYLPEDGAPVQRDYPLAASSRTTLDMAAEPELMNRSFGALVTFDTPGMAERAMYFGDSPLFSGGHDSSGATAPSRSWVLAEGATGVFFDTFILIANPGDTRATVTMTYLPASGLAVQKTHVIEAHQRLTINIAEEDLSLASAAIGTTVSSDQPVIAERSQYWPHGGWYEAHNSAGETAPDTKWALAEGRVGGENHAQTYILLANAGSQPAVVTATFMREDGTTVVKTFTVNPTSRLNIGIHGPDGDVPELSNENFATLLVSTQPIIVERSMYTDANGVTWAAGTNATGTRLP